MTKLKKSEDITDPASGVAIHATAFFSGVAVMIIEIAGARSLAPFFGSSLQVWTAQITATLLFLALGYRLGAWLAQKPRSGILPAVYFGAGLWLSGFALMRSPVLAHASETFGVAVGSFVSACVLFGIPLLGLGAVSPLLVERFPSNKTAGFSAGAVFFTGTLGNLAGGWLTALLLIPYCSLRWSLLGTALGLVALGILWVVWGKGMSPVKAIVPTLGILGMLIVSPGRVTSFGGGSQPLMQVVFSQQSSVGLLQILDAPDAGARTFLMDGVMEGGMFLSTGHSFMQFSQSLNYFSWRYHPSARSALVLGLGAGLLAKELHERGLQVTAVELEPQVVTLAKKYFGLPDAVQVAVEDGRHYVRRHTEKFDLIFLDVFAAETTPFYLVSEEAFGDLKNRLNPGGRVLVNSPARTSGNNPGLDRLEASLVRSFPEALVFVDRLTSPGSGQVTNAVVVAGENLRPAKGEFPGEMHPHLLSVASATAQSPQKARSEGPVQYDDRSDMDLADSPLRLEWRRAEMKYFGPDLLAD